MKNIFLTCEIVVLFLLFACSDPKIDEKYISKIVTDKLAISGTIFTKKITTGTGGSFIFSVNTENSQYIVKIIPQKNEGQIEIYNSKVASDGGYGSKVYFADPAKGILIMEYLEGTKIAYDDLKSNKLYIQVADLLQKMHHGKAFIGKFDLFENIHKSIKLHKNSVNNYIPLEKLEHITNVIQEALLPFLTNAPCHNDLWIGNLKFLETECKAIDYGMAAIGDPYFDLATFVHKALPTNEKIFLTTYLGHKPTPKEEAKLYLSKQLVLLNWLIAGLNRLQIDDLVKYPYIETPKNFSKDFFEGKVTLNQTETNLLCLKNNLNQLLSNFESTDFKKAINILKKM